MKHGLGLTTETLLLVVVSSLTLCQCECCNERFGIQETTNLGEIGSLSGLVLSDLVESVLMAFLSLAKCLSLFWNVHHLWIDIRCDTIKEKEKKLV